MDGLGFWVRNTRIGESIARRSQRPRRTDLGMAWRKGAFGGRFRVLGEKHPHRGEHRTEVTEATEDGFGMADEGGL